MTKVERIFRNRADTELFAVLRMHRGYEVWEWDVQQQSVRCHGVFTVGDDLDLETARVRAVGLAFRHADSKPESAEAPA
mgnify:CR=1 FL=1